MVDEPDRNDLPDKSNKPEAPDDETAEPEIEVLSKSTDKEEPPRTNQKEEDEEPEIQEITKQSETPDDDDAKVKVFDRSSGGKDDDEEATASIPVVTFSHEPETATTPEPEIEDFTTDSVGAPSQPEEAVIETIDRDGISDLHENEPVITEMTTDGD